MKTTFCTPISFPKETKHKYQDIYFIRLISTLHNLKLTHYKLKTGAPAIETIYILTEPERIARPFLKLRMFNRECKKFKFLICDNLVSLNELV